MATRPLYPQLPKTSPVFKGNGLLQAVRLADKATGASKLASDAYWSFTHPIDRLTGKGRAAHQSMEVPWVAGRPWFHGSSRVFEKPDPSKASPASLYGPGHYITDDPKIASSYTSKGAPDPTPTEIWDFDFLDSATRTKPAAVKHAREMVLGYVKRAREEARAHGEPFRVERVRGMMPGNGPPARGYRILPQVPENFGPNVTRYAFEPDDVFDIQAPVTPAAKSRLVDALSDMPPAHARDMPPAARAVQTRRHYEPLVEGPTLNAVWHALENRIGAKRANEVLRRAGYDAIAYPGGRMTGGRSHNALVVLNQAPLKRGGIPNPKYAGMPRPVHRRDT